MHLGVPAIAHAYLLVLSLSFSLLSNGFLLHPVAITKLTNIKGLRSTGDDDEFSKQQLNYDTLDHSDRMPSPPNHRCGYVSLVGAPNMGKSTILNALIQEQLCVTTPRPQTTRHSILGILNSAGNLEVEQDERCPCQVLFLDTPGVIEDPAYKLQEGMMQAVKGAFQDSDVILLVTDLFSTPIPDDVLFQKIVDINSGKNASKTVIVLINKVDLVDRINPDKQNVVHSKASENVEEEVVRKRTTSVLEAVTNWRQLVPDAFAILPLCATNGSNDPGLVALRTMLTGGPDVPRTIRNMGRPVNGMFRPGVKFIQDEEARSLLPLCPPLYSQDSLTDRSERFFASEIIRAALFRNLGKELPYCCEVRIEEFREPKPGDNSRVVRINGIILVERESQKGIVVGKGGQKIKDVGTAARKELEEFLQDKVHINLKVKVEKNWRKDEEKLREFGYLN